MTLLAISAQAYWVIALLIGLVAALVVAALLAVLVSVGHEHRAVGGRPARRRNGRAGNTANIPQLEATAPVLGLIVTRRSCRTAT